MLWLRDGTALSIEVADDLSEYHGLVVVIEGIRDGSSFILQTIKPSREKPDSFLNSGDL